MKGIILSVLLAGAGGISISDFGAVEKLSITAIFAILIWVLYKRWGKAEEKIENIYKYQLNEKNARIEKLENELKELRNK